MAPILLDENLPIAQKRLLAGHEVATAKEMGRKGSQNGASLALAQQSGFEVLITGDKNLGYQQNPLDARLPWSSCRNPSGRS